MHRHTVTIALLGLLALAGFTQAAQNITSSLVFDPQSSVTGQYTIHTIKWQTSTPINVRGHIIVSYENEFNVDQLIMVTSFDPATMNGRFEKDSVVTASGWKHVYISRKNDNDDPANGQGLVGLNLALVGNPAPGNYDLMIRTYPQDVTGGWVAQDSGKVSVTIYPPIANFNLVYGEPDNPKAGQPFALKVQNAVDADGKAADGIVNISFIDAFNNHIAPDGTEPVLVAIPVQDGLGEADQILYLDEPGYVQLRGSVAGGSYSATLPGNGLNIFPGVLGRFDLTGYPATAVAGLNFSPNNVTVTAYDKWDNLKVDYRGQVYFDSDTDPTAFFDYDGVGSPDYYTFTALDNGTHNFSNDSFSFRKSGTHTFKVLNKEQTVTETSGPIQVSAGAIASFDFVSVSTQKAGQAFQLSVTNAKDSGGNLASGTITVAFANGTPADHAAVNGQLPILNTISVVNGSGSGSQFLVKAEQNMQFRGTVNGSSPAITRTTNLFTVTPGDLARLSITTPAQAQIGQPFSSDVVVKAYDSFGSLKTNFLGQVTFNDYNNQDPGAVLPASYTFTTADQGTHTFPKSQFILNTQGEIRLEIASGSITQVSDPIRVTGINSIILHSISTANDFVSRGQNGVSVSMRVVNNGTDIFTYNSATLVFRDSLGTVISSDYVVPSVGSGQIPASGGDVIIPFTVNVNSNAGLGDVEIDGSIVGTYPSGSSQATANVVDSWQVQRPAALQIVSTTMDATIPRGSSPNTITVRVANNSGLTLSADAIVNSINFTFTDETLANVSSEFPVTPVSVLPATVAGGGTADFTFNMQSKATAPDGTITVGVAVNYEDANSAKTGLVSNNAATSFESINPGDIKIVSITPEQSTVTRGQTNVEVDVDVVNLGSSDVTISPNWADTFIEFKRGNTTYISSETNQGDVQLISAPTISAGDTGTVRFRITQVRTTVPAGNLQIYATARTTNGIESSSEDENVYGELIVQDAENITITNVIPSRQTVTVNDDTTPWEVEVVVENKGGSDVFFDLVNTTLNFSIPGFTVDTPTVSDDNTLSAGEEETLTFRVTRNGSTAGTATIGATIHYDVINTGASKTASGGATGTVDVQREADVVILSTNSSLPSVTQNTSPAWTVSVVIENQGGAEVDINLNDTANTWLRFHKDNIWINNFNMTRPTRLAGKGGTRLAGGERDSLIYTVTSNSADPGTYVLKAAVKSVELNRQLVLNTATDDLLFGTVEIAEQANLLYNGGSLTPTIINPGRPWTFSLVVNNNSGALVELDADKSTFTLNGGSSTYQAKLSPTSPTTIQPNDYLQIFFENYMSPNFPLGNYVPVVRLEYLDNNLPGSTNLNMLGEQVSVVEAGDLLLSYIRPSVQTVTRGQSKTWTVTIGVTNNSTSALELKTAKLKFFSLTNEVTSQYTVTNPIGLASGNASITSGQSDSLRFTITKVNDTATTGAIVINGLVTMNDVLDDNNELSQNIDNQASVTVQSPAILSITSSRPSQKSITRGQTQPWTIGVRVKNTGQSTVKLDSGTTKLDIFSYTENFTYPVPTIFVNSGSDTLFGGQEDSLFFTITQVPATLAATPPGDSIRVAVYVGTVEMNTDKSIIPNTVANPTNLAVNDRARIRIEKFEAMIASPDSTVNKGGEFYLRALVSNSGDEKADHLKQATVTVQTNSPGYTFSGGAKSDTASVFNLEPGESAWTDSIRVFASSTVGSEGQFPIPEVNLIYTAARNAKDMFVVDNSNAKQIVVRAQNPAVFAVDSVVTSTNQLSTGSSLPWSIYAHISNKGDGLVELYDPLVSDVVIRDIQGQAVDPRDYTLQVIPPTNNQLGNGDARVIEYRVLQTWRKTGDFNITVTVRAKQLNDLTNDLKPSDFAVVNLSNNAEIKIQETVADTSTVYANVDGQGVVHVNTGQQFIVGTKIFNSSNTFIDTARVELAGVNSSVTPAFREITLLDSNSPRTVNFTVTADAAENLAGEILKSTITKAIDGNGGDANILDAIDDSVIVRIYEPAKLRILATENLAPNAPNISLGHNFKVDVVVQNEGSEAARNVAVKLAAQTPGLVTVESPGYKILPGDLAGGAADTLTFLVTVGNTAGLVNLRSSVIQGFGINDRAVVDTLASIDNIAAADLKPGAKLVIDQVIPTKLFITAREQNKPWYLKVAVSNSGAADLKFVGIADTNITFSQNGVVDTDYEIREPNKLENAGNFVLPAGATDTLRYTIEENGRFLNQVDIDVTLNAVDLNTDQTKILADSGSATIQVSSNAAVGLARTRAITNVTDTNGNGLVNYGQDFRVEAAIQTGQSGGAKNVIVKLTAEGTNGTSFIGALYDTLTTIKEDTTVNALFNIKANAGWNFDLGEITEKFTAEIVSAVAEDGTTPILPRDPLQGNNEANVRIQTPAVLSYSLQVGEKGGALVELGEVFDLYVKMHNLGRAPIGSGKITLEPPIGGYKVKNQIGDFIDFSFEKQFSWPIDQDSLNVIFTMMAPDSVSGPDSIKTFLTDRPIDRNTDSVLVALGPIDSVVVVNTVDELLTIENFTIDGPEGATDGTLSTDQFFTLKAVIKSAQNLEKRQAVLEKPEDLAYAIQSPEIVNISMEQQTVTWTIQAPNNIINDPHEFSLKVSTDPASENFVSVSDVVEIVRVEKKTSLSLQKIAFDPAGVLKNDDFVTLSTDQTARIIAIIANDGAGYEGTGYIQIEGLTEANLNLIAGDESTEFQVGIPVDWTIRAPLLSDSDVKTVTVRVIADSVTDSNSGNPVTVSPASQSFNVIIDERGTIKIIALDVKPEENDSHIDSVSSEQNFRVVAEIETEGVMETDISAELSSLSGVFKPASPLYAIPASGRHVAEWTVRAPNYNGNRADSLSVLVKAKDLESEQWLDPHKKSTWVPIAERTTFEFEPYISAPARLENDDRVSTGQDFSITVKIDTIGASFLATDDAEDVFRFHLYDLSNSFTLSDGETWNKSITAREFRENRTLPTWRLKAPEDKLESLADFEIRVEKIPRDMFSYQQAKANSKVEFRIQTVEKAKVTFDAYLNDQEFLDSTGVRSGNNFTVTAWLRNAGGARMTGDFKVQLTLPDTAGFTIAASDTLIKTQKADSSDTVTWTISAPRGTTIIPDSFRLKILQLPLDEFSRQFVFLERNDSTAAVEVTLETGALIINNFDVQGSQTAVVRGDTSAVLGLSVRNRGSSDDVFSSIDSLKVSVKDVHGKFLSARSLFNWIAAVDADDSSKVYAELSTFGDSGTIVFSFPDDTLRIKGTEEKRIKFLVSIPATASMQDFRLEISDTSYIDADDEFHIPLAITIQDTVLMSKMALMIDADINKSFFNYPNPFGRLEDPITKFTYYLKEESSVEIRIYTLTGDLVRTFDSSRDVGGDSWTRPGLHQAEITWDGTNGMGHKVLNGVYLAYMITEHEKPKMIKIAVVK